MSHLGTSEKRKYYIYIHKYIYMPETRFLDFLKTVIPPDAFKAFLCGSIFDKSAFCLGEKQGMLVNNECSSWYNRVGNF